MKSVESIKLLLKNKAKEKNRLYDEILMVYMIERLIYRISISKYNEKFILKGGILLYALFSEKYPRGTRDADYLVRNIENSIEKITEVFTEICTIDYLKDFIKYDIDSLKVVKITEFKEYHGLSVSITSYLGKSKQKVSVDIGFGDVIYPNEQKIEFPTLLGEDSPQINAYPIESVISEKYEAIVSLGELNTRYKDFYDIYLISKTNKIKSNELAEALKKTFSKRNSKFNDFVIFNEEYFNDNKRSVAWNRLKKNKNINDDVKFDETILHIKTFILPIIKMIESNDIKNKLWNPSKNKWLF